MFNGIFRQAEFYYEQPFQVIFLRPDDTKPLYDKGIAYKGNIISACDGEAFTVRKVLACARRCGIDWDYAIVESPEWKPLDMD
jgi:hypothetical protein